MKLSLVIPCYNEQNNIEAIVDKVIAIPFEDKEIVVVDDGSREATLSILREKITPRVDRVLYHEKNQGKGAALRTGFAACTGDVVIVQDADLEYDPMEIPKVIAPILDGEADVAYGSRFLVKPKDKGYLANFLANRFLTAFSNLRTKLKLTDMETCYKAFKREVIQAVDIKENRFGFEPEITAKIAKMKCRVTEVPISYVPRTFAEGKKINIKDGLRAVYAIFKY